MAQQRNRITWIDMAKGYGMILVILAHCDVGVLGGWIYTFHMPLFFFLSGYVFNPNNDFVTFLKKKCKSMIIPYFCLGIPMLLYDGLEHYIRGNYTIRDFAHLVLNFVIQRRMWTLWFLACLFFLNSMFYFTQKVLKTSIKLAVFSIVSVAVGLVYYRYIGISLPWNIDVCLMAYPFFFVGYFYKSKHEIVDKFLGNRLISIILFVVLTAANATFGYLTYRVSGTGLEMFYSSYGCAPLTYISAFSGIASVIIASKLVTFKPLQYIGENSMLYFAWHQTIMIPISLILLNLMHISIDASSNLGFVIVYKLIQLLMILAMLTICNMIISRTKLKVILGKS